MQQATDYNATAVDSAVPEHDRPRPTRIWLLDIDGTLMPTGELDNRCYWRAIDDTVGGAPDCLDLDDFEHVTDRGILEEWSRRTRGRPPSDAELARIRRRFLELLADEFRRCPASFRPMPGLEEWLAATLADPGTRIALATGGWSHTARFKLRASGLARYRLPLASSDDAATRTGIMRVARQRALAADGDDRAAGDDSTTICVGDGAWDLRASRELGWRFVGIGGGTAAERLARAGAARVVADFRALTDGSMDGLAKSPGRTAS